MILIQTFCKDEHEASTISRRIVEKKLAAVVHRWPTHAVYASDRGIHEMPAYSLLIQTLETKLQAIEELVEQERSYTTPFVGAIDVRRVNHSYRQHLSGLLH